MHALSPQSYIQKQATLVERAMILCIWQTRVPWPTPAPSLARARGRARSADAWSHEDTPTSKWVPISVAGRRSAQEKAQGHGRHDFAVCVFRTTSRPKREVVSLRAAGVGCNPTVLLSSSLGR